MKKILSVIPFLCLLSTFYAQTLVNKEWAVSNAHPVGFDWFSSAVDLNKQLITVGNTFVTGQGANLLVQKFNNEGDIAWQRLHNSSGNNDDYGVATTTDINGNVYVCGTTKNNGQFDVLVVKYDTDGTQQWAVQYNSSFNRNDAATAIKVDSDGNVYVAAASEGETTLSDFLLLKLNTSGTNVWQKRYDYANLIEIPAGLEFDANGNLLIVGASASDFTNWDYAVVRYNTEGVLQNAVRNNVAGAGFDQPVAVKKDGLGNIYVTGKASNNGVNYDIKTVKFNPSLSVAWVRTFDGSGLEDVAKDLQIDNEGNVFIAGYSTKSNGLKELTILKYDTDGNTEWTHKQDAKDDSGDALAKSLDVDDDGKVYFIGEEKGNDGSKDVVIMKLDTDGHTVWSKNIASASEETPTAIKVDNEDNIYVSAIEKQGTTATYKTVKYKEYKTDTAVIRNNAGKPIAMAHQIIVRFNENVINRDAVDGTIGTADKVFDDLTYFLKPQAATTIQQKLLGLCTVTTGQSSTSFCPIKMTKVFPQLKTTDTVTISRMGEQIPIPPFWATFVLHFTEGVDIRKALDSLNRLFPTVIYAEPNYLAELTASSNDSLYRTEQASLHPTSVFPNANVNVEPAWDIEVGKPTIKIGVFDTGLDWKHEDFGYDGRRDTTSRMTDGWDFETSTRLRSLSNPDLNGHGTACAGIIGAIRNNTKGIAGIAGGDSLVNQKGVSLYGLKIFNSGGGPYSATLNYISDAIVTTSLDTGRNYGYGLNVMNHSWGFDETVLSVFTEANISSITEAVHFANRAKVTFAAARGNEGYNNRAYPSITDDDWVLAVGGTGRNGEFNQRGVNSSFTTSSGWEIDVAAPADSAIQRTLRSNGSYRNFSGTSAATPHAAGAAGLLMSYLNRTTASYANLSPEDVESILQKTATDVGPRGVDSTTGFGRLNIGEALRNVRRPFWRVDHFGTTNNSRSFKITPYSSRDTINLEERYRNESGLWFQKGKYIVKTFKVEATVNHNLPTTDNIFSYWARPSSSDVLQLFDRNKNLKPRERIVMDSASVTRTSAKMYGYVYQVYDSLDRYQGWWPIDTNATRHLEYTLWIRDNRSLSGTNEQEAKNSIQNVLLFPNPTPFSQTLKIVSSINDNLDISLFDVTGRLVQHIFSGRSQIGDNDFSVNLSGLAVGFYMYRIQNGQQTEYIKTIKN
jgi:uncharacterized delta-60 repeat protein